MANTTNRMTSTIEATMLKPGHHITTTRRDGTTLTRRVIEVIHSPGLVHYKTDADTDSPARWEGWQIPETHTLRITEKS